MLRKIFAASVLVLCSAEGLFAQCDGCVPDETCTTSPAFPSLCPANAPDATAGAYYQADFTFWMPASFTDPGTGFAVDLLQLTITGVSGLPFGLQFTPNAPGGVYYPPEYEFGCARICGTPVGQGTYTVTISVLAHVSASGFELDVPQEFAAMLNVLPGSGGNTSFSYSPTSGCGSVTSTFSALIDASPAPTSYAWDFGNGSTSTSAQPPPQTFSAPGTYVITLETTIGGFVLNSVVLTGVNGNWCGDVEEPSLPFIGCSGDPDPYFVLTDANGATTTSGTLDNSTTGSWNDLGLLLGTPPYSISFYDEDAVSQDDLLGTYNIPANGAGTYFMNVAGGTTGSLNISNEPQQVFSDSDTVLVFAEPEVLIAEDDATGELCATDTDLIGFQWLLNGTPVTDATEPCVLPSGPGIWQLIAGSGEGCSDTSNAIVVCPVFNIAQTGGVLLVPGGYASYAWTYNGVPVGGNEQFLLLQGDGLYGVTVDAGNGCIIVLEFLHDMSGLNDPSTNAGTMGIFPNPTQGPFMVVAEGLEDPVVQVVVVDARGAVVHSQSAIVSGGAVRQPLDVPLTAGIHMVRLIGSEHTRVQKLVVR